MNLPRKKTPTTLSEADVVLDQVHDHLVSCEALRKKHTSTIQELRSRRKELLSRQQSLEHVYALAVKASEMTQAQIRIEMTSILTLAISAVFGPAYSVDVIFDFERGRSSANLILKIGDEVRDPMKECGGGVVDVLAFALRLTVWALSRPLPRRTLILDEPFRFVSAKHKPKVAQIFDTKYVVHGKDFKPNDEYRNKYEKQINHSYFER
jgi:DNA repair exonuclease SbcCD ATPase subunit